MDQSKSALQGHFYNPAIGKTTAIKTAKYCLALNYIFEHELMRSGDSGKLFDSFLDSSGDDASNHALGKILSSAEGGFYKNFIKNTGLTHQNFAVSLVEQLQGAEHRNTVTAISPVFDGCISFIIDASELAKIEQEFPRHHGTLKIFDTAQERSGFACKVQAPCVSINQKDDIKLYLDA